MTLFNTALNTELIDFVWKSAAILLGFYTLYRIVLHKQTQFKFIRVYLLVGLAASFLLPFIKFSKTVWVQQLPTLSHITPNTVEANTLITTEPTFSFLNFILWVYLAGITVFTLHLLWQLLGLAIVLTKHPIVKENGWWHIQTTGNQPPFSFFNFIVYNPEAHSSDALKHILLHEKAHATQAHSVDVLIAHLFCIIQWYNPLVWYYKKALTENLEFLADKAATQHFPSKKAYQITLINQSCIGTVPVLANTFYQSFIKKRIVMLNTHKTQRKPLFKTLILLPALAFFLWSFNVETTYKQQPNSAERTLSTSNEISFTITKKTTDAELDKMKAILKTNYDVTLKFSNLKRNKDGHITSISIEAASKNSNANVEEDMDEGINPITISYNAAKESLHIGSMHKRHFKYRTKKGEGGVFVMDAKDMKKGMKWKHKGDHKMGKKVKVIVEEDEDGKKIEKRIIIEGDGDDSEGDNVFFFKSDDAGEDSEEDVFIVKSDGKEVSKKVIRKGSNMVIELDGDGAFDISGDKKLFFMDTDGKDPLVFIDGKKASKKDLEKLDPDSIERIDVLKGDKAIEEFGKDAKDGVIKVTTKK